MSSSVAVAKVETFNYKQMVITKDGPRATGYRGNNRQTGNLHFSPQIHAADLPAAYDLRTLGMVSKIKDQRSCGSPTIP